MKTVAEQIADLEAKRAANVAQMEGVMQKSLDEGRSTEKGEAEEFDALQDEIKAIDSDLVRLKALEKINGAKAAPVAGKDTEGAANARDRSFATVKTAENLEPGIAFARYAMCLTKAKGNHEVAFRLAERNYPQTEAVVKTLKFQAEGGNLQELMQMKATVPAGTSTDSTWALPLVYAGTFAGDFLNYLRPRTLMGQAQFRPVPFNVRIGGQTSGGTAGWVGQGKSKPVTKFDFNATTIPFTKVAAIAVITQELARFSDPSAERLVRDSLADCVIARVDSDLFDPDVAAVANVSPAGLLYGVSPVAGPSSGTAAAIRAALMRLWAPWDTSFIGARPAYYTTPGIARYLATLRDDNGQQSFPGMTMTGGMLDGVPVRVSQYLANNGGSGGAPLILVDEAEVYLADDGSVTLDASEQATIEMSDAPVGSSSATVTSNGSPFVSMWQTNSIAFRAERFIWWGLRRSGAINWIDGFPTS